MDVNQCWYSINRSKFRRWLLPATRYKKKVCCGIRICTKRPPSWSPPLTLLLLPHCHGWSGFRMEITWRLSHLQPPSALKNVGGTQGLVLFTCPFFHIISKGMRDSLPAREWCWSCPLHSQWDSASPAFCPFPQGCVCIPAGLLRSPLIELLPASCLPLLPPLWLGVWRILQTKAVLC